MEREQEELVGVRMTCMDFAIRLVESSGQGLTTITEQAEEIYDWVTKKEAEKK